MAFLPLNPSSPTNPYPQQKIKSPDEYTETIPSKDSVDVVEKVDLNDDLNPLQEASYPPSSPDSPVPERPKVDRATRYPYFTGSIEVSFARTGIEMERGLSCVSFGSYLAVGVL